MHDCGCTAINKWAVGGVASRLGLFEQFFDFMSLDHANNNVHNMRLCRLALQHRALSPAAIATRQAAAQVCSRPLLIRVWTCGW